MPTPIRLCHVFRGQVQGVGFRATVRSLARGFEVVGYVRNLDDGGVEMVAEGAPSEVDAFVEAIRAEMGWGIRSETVAPLNVGDTPLDSFSIRP
jgi:acylphosphatase